LDARQRNCGKEFHRFRLEAQSAVIKEAAIIHRALSTPAGWFLESTNLPLFTRTCHRFK
jgi:hypothetical protein